MQWFSIFLAGFLFSTGLIISGMINPQKVLNFLDVFGAWDPSLAFVMFAAIFVNAIGLRLILRRKSPLFSAKFSIPTRTDINARLIIGAAGFGIGWGIVGFCPGPAVAAVGIAPAKTLIFIAAMLVGMYTAKFWTQHTSN